MPNERYQRIKEAVRAAQVAEDHGLQPQPDGQGREKALCPYHDDHNPSLKLFADGYFKCFACDASGDAISLEQHLGSHGSASEAASALEERHYLADAGDGLASVSNIKKPRKPEAAPKAKNNSKKKQKKAKEVSREEEKRWTIRDSEGTAHAIHIRYRTLDEDGNEGKSYSYRNPDGSFEAGAIKTHAIPLYLSELVSGYDPVEPVVLTEGEKAADAAAQAGLQVVATTAGTNVVPDAEYLEVLRSCTVLLWPDADDPGKKHMAEMAEALQDIADEVRWFEWTEAPETGDAADHPAVTGSEGLDDLRQALQEAPAYNPEQHRPEDEKKGQDNAEESKGKAGGKKKSRSPADRMISYVEVQPGELFVDQFGAPHILWEKNEPVPLTSSFDPHLRRLFYSIEEQAAGADAVKQARDTLAAFALGSDNVKELHVRAAFWKGKLYYQLGVGRIIEVDRDGYRPVTDPPMLFRNVKNLQPLPDPEDGGSFDVLRNWVNLKNGRDKRMYIVWLVTAALPHIARPMLEATGVMGSGKTTASRVAKRALDPGKPEMVRPDPREFLQKASHAHLVMLDNQNSLPEWAVDTLCRLVTGEADSKRVLYTDDDDLIYEMRRGIVLNGINAPTDRGDARDRTLPVELERIPDTEYRPEEEMWEEFEREHPQLLGAIFETLAAAIRTKGSLRLDRRARLADWSEYAAAVYEVLGWGADKFSEDWSRVVEIQNQGTLEGSTLAQAIMHFMASREEWEGLATDLHAKLEVEAEEMSIDVKRDKSWPKSSSWLWRRIKEVKPLLTALGIDAYREVERSGTKVYLSTITAPDPGGGDDETGRRGSSEGERGSRFEMLPQVLPRHTSHSQADRGGSGSSGSISGYSEDSLSRASKVEKANYPQNPENAADLSSENPDNRKVPRNAATATDAATEGVSEHSGETREADIDEALEDLDNPRSEAPEANASGSESSGGNEEAVAKFNAMVEQRRRELGIEREGE